MEFTQRRIELVLIRRIRGFLPRIASAAGAEVQDQQNGDHQRLTNVAMIMGDCSERLPQADRRLSRAEPLLLR